MNEGTHLQYILPDLGHLGEELQCEYRAHDAETAECDAAVVIKRRVSGLVLRVRFGVMD